MKRRISTVFAATLVVLLAGCVNLRQDSAEKRYYVLEAARSGPAAEVSFGDSVLSVRTLKISSRYADTQMVYRTGEYTWQSDFYNRWFIAPEAMVRAEVVDWLRAAGLFRHVVDTASAIDSTHVIEGLVNEFYGDFSDPDTPRAVLKAQFLLLDTSGTYARILFQKTYQVTQPLEESSSLDLASGLSQALGALLAEFESDLSTHLGRKGS